MPPDRHSSVTAEEPEPEEQITPLSLALLVLAPVTSRSSRASPGPVRAALESEGIEWRHYYPEPVYRAPALGAGRLPAGTCPEAERACAEAVAIPVRSSLEPETIRYIAGVIRRALGGPLA